ncbi:MAG: hypothetical protein A3B79_03670 [Deltaproteobacteria bacterium RIFCSPHIGHO2_02_FULL_50_15]|nr:MAG: hypothetical protein A3B79_03670 [Deltaproteobacteria bacterium RIFCSPHIGHO2_02_FULL_50_15]
MSQKIKYSGKPVVLQGRATACRLLDYIHGAPSSIPAEIASMAGLAMTGGRAGCFVTAKTLIHAHDSLFAAAGKHLPLVIHLGCGSLLKASLSFYAGHDAYHGVSDTGVAQLFAKNVQEVADFSLIAHRISELALVPALVAQDQVLTTETAESLLFPEDGLMDEYLGCPEDEITSPTPSQKMIFGKKRRRIPVFWGVERPMMSGIVQGPRGLASSVAAEKTFYSDHIVSLTQRALEEYAQLTGRSYDRLGTYKVKGADYLIVGQGSLVTTAEAVADYLGKERGLKIGVVNLTMFRPFPGDLLGALLKDRKGVVVVERLDQPMAEDLPLMREVRSVIYKCQENAGVRRGEIPYPGYAVYEKNHRIPALYSAILGGGGIQAADLIEAVDNMLPKGKRQKRISLSVHFAPSKILSPKQEIQYQEILEGYPEIKTLESPAGKCPDLLPEGSYGIELHGTGDQAFSKRGQRLATLFSELLGSFVKARSENKPQPVGHPAAYHIVCAPEPVRIDSVLQSVDAVVLSGKILAPMASRLNHLKKGGVLILQNPLSSPDDIWAAIPREIQSIIVDRKIRVWALDFSKIPQEETSKEEGGEEREAKILFGALLAALGISKKGGGGLVEIRKRDLGLKKEGVEILPPLLKGLPRDTVPVADIHRFWAQTGYPFSVDQKEDAIPADPFMAMGLLPAGTGLLHDFSSLRTQHPQWLPEKCTGCGDCWTVCPDSALPPLVHELGEIFEATLKYLEKGGHAIKHLPRAVRNIEKNLQQSLSQKQPPAAVSGLLGTAIDDTIASFSSSEKDEGVAELNLLKKTVANFPWALTQPFYKNGEGGLLSITLNPDKCKGCMECVKECPEGALISVTQTDQGLGVLRKNFDFWQSLPNTNRKFIRTENLAQDKAYTTLLLDKRAYHAVVGGDTAAPGSAKKTVLHLFAGVAEALMQSRRQIHREHINSLVERLEKHIKLQLAVNIKDAAEIHQVMESFKGRDLMLSDLSKMLEKKGKPIDTAWLSRVTQALSQLRKLQVVFSEENEGRHAGLGMVGNGSHSAAWGSTFPYNPFSFPWAQHLLGESPSFAMGLFEGHMKKLTEAFRVIRIAELELEGKYNARCHDAFFEKFSWRDLTSEEFKLCPPIVITGTARTLYGWALQNLNKILKEGIPIKVLVLDSFQSPAFMPLLGILHQNTYVLQGGMGDIPRLVQGLVEGLEVPLPALFHVFVSRVPENGFITDSATEQARLALQSRAHPFLSYHPDRGETLLDRLSLDGNVSMEDAWPTHTLQYMDEAGQKATQEVSMTFADFAVTEGSFKEHFSTIPSKEQGEGLVSVAEFLGLEAEDREGKTPFVWWVDEKKKLDRLKVSGAMIGLCEERQAFWKGLKSFKRLDITPVDGGDMKGQVHSQLIEKMTHSLVELAYGHGDIVAQLTQVESHEKGKLV